MTTQICNKCGVSKDISEFFFRKDTGTYRKICKECHNVQAKLYAEINRDDKREYNKQYHQDHKEERSAYRKQYHEDNKERENERNRKYAETHSDELSEYFRKYREEHREESRSYQKEYAVKNKHKVRVRKAKYVKEKRKNDPIFRLKSIVSAKIATILKTNGGGKNGQSISDHVPYSIEKLLAHLESQFESWMTWDNYGRYNSKTWDDSDISTWTWQLDHIIPLSDLPHKTMEEENFLKAWALDNLRPYPSKLNVLDGINKVRHRK